MNHIFPPSNWADILDGPGSVSINSAEQGRYSFLSQREEYLLPSHLVPTHDQVYWDSKRDVYGYKGRTYWIHLYIRLKPEITNELRRRWAVGDSWSYHLRSDGTLCADNGFSTRPFARISNKEEILDWLLVSDLQKIQQSLEFELALNIPESSFYYPQMLMRQKQLANIQKSIEKRTKYVEIF